ncbi:hypothetical protein EON77_14410 [bacterium]|nr:MAG: hypothetical protein EON77_14410 [bacterium]
MKPPESTVFKWNNSLFLTVSAGILTAGCTASDISAADATESTQEALSCSACESAPLDCVEAQDVAGEGELEADSEADDPDEDPPIDEDPGPLGGDVEDPAIDDDTTAFPTSWRKALQSELDAPEPLEEPVDGALEGEPDDDATEDNEASRAI